MSRTKAPGGAFTSTTLEPASYAFRSQGSGEPIDASPVRIARMLQQLAPNEQAIRDLESLPVLDGYRMMKVGGQVRRVHPVKHLVRAKKARDKHVDDIRHAIDYHLNTLAFEDVPCPGCRLPSAALEFAAAVATFEEPAIRCEACLGRGVVRAKRKDPESVAAAKRVNYFSKVLDDTIRCAKIKTGASDANQAYMELEAANRNLLIKFGSEKQTSLEGADAEQGVRQGIIDAARRFDPTRKEGALFNTVAYNWCRRNSRARKQGQKRAGVYALSIEAMGSDEDGNGAAAMITSSEGALGTFHALSGVGPSLVLDIREHVDALPELQRVVVSSELSGLSIGEISALMGLPRAKVRSLRASAFETLRRPLSGYVSALHD